jgi:membrane protein YqaA with SNARE-associated domain
MNRKTKRIAITLSVISIFILWSFMLYYFSPDKIVEIIGINNSYVLLLIFGFLGGTSIFFPFPYYLFVLTFSGGGLNPFLIGFLTGTGVMLGDCTSYFVGYIGREIAPKGLLSVFKRVYEWGLKKPKWILPSLLYLYTAIFPLPNDFILVPLGMTRYPFLRVIIPMWLGSITFNTILAITGFYAFSYIF